VVDGKEIPFDFEGSAEEIFMDENGYGIEMQTQYHGFFKCTDIDFLVFSGVYEKTGIHPQNITAAFLASTTAITEFGFTICMNGADEDSEATQTLLTVLSSKAYALWTKTKKCITWTKVF